MGLGLGIGIGAGVLLVIAAVIFFTIRFSYYLPFVALKEEAPALGRSWKLTRSSFWRLFLLCLLVGIITSVFSWVVTLLTFSLIGQGLLGQVVQHLISLLVLPMTLVPYAVSFYDLRDRTEGTGLQGMIEQTVYGGAAQDLQAADREPGPAGNVGTPPYGTDQRNE